MSTDAVCRAEMDSENPAELADLVAAMNVTANRMTPPNGYRTHRSQVTQSHRKMSLQERRIPRQPTIETKRVSITDGEVSGYNLLLTQYVSYEHITVCSCAGLCSAKPIQAEK